MGNNKELGSLGKLIKAKQEAEAIEKLQAEQNEGGSAGANNSMAMLIGKKSSGATPLISKSNKAVLPEEQIGVELKVRSSEKRNDQSDFSLPAIGKPKDQDQDTRNQNSDRD